MMSYVKKVHGKPRLHVSANPLLGSMATILRDSTVVVVAVTRTRPRAIPLTMIIMRKSTHGFPFLSYMSMGLRLGARSSANNNNSGALVAQRATKQSPILIWERKGNPWVDFLMIIIASGIARGRVHMTTTMATDSRNMAAILQILGSQRHCSLGLPGSSLILDIHVMINWHLSKHGICWPVSRDHIAGSIVQLIEIRCLFEVDHWPSAGFLLDPGLMSG